MNWQDNNCKAEELKTKQVFFGFLLMGMLGVLVCAKVWADSDKSQCFYLFRFSSLSCLIIIELFILCS